MKKAFTLIELLVVIAIIAILAAILFPVFAQAKEAAKKTNDLSQLKQLATSNLIYAADEDDNFLSFPYANTQWSSPTVPANGAGPFWSDRLMPYVKNKGIFANPANTDDLWGPNSYWFPGQTSATDTNVNNRYRVTYSMNHMINRGDKSPTNAGSTSQTAIDEVSKVTMLGPSLQAWNFSTCVPETAGSNNMQFVWLISQDNAFWGYELWGKKNEKGGFTGGGANFAFSDGHAKFSKSVRGGTAAGDTIGYKSSDLFWGYFPRAVTRANVSTDGTCPGDRGSIAY